MFLDSCVEMSVCVAKFPYINDKINNYIKKEFSKQEINIRLAQKTKTLGDILKSKIHTNKPEENHNCSKRNCPINDKKKCYRNRLVYKITCKECKEFYIGYTDRHLHTSIKEHLNNKTSSLMKHLLNCQPTSINNQNNAIQIDILSSHKDLIDTQISEAFEQLKENPKINSKEELVKDNIFLYK